MDYYQAGSSVNISVFAKNVEKCEVNFAATNCQVQIAFKDGTKFAKEIQFPEATDPSRCSFKVGSVKVEIKVAKLTPNEWQLSF